jgi:hypothetical protein
VRVVENSDVELAAMQPVEQIAGIGADQAQLDLRVRLAEGRDQGNRDDVGHGRRKADGDLTAQGLVGVRRCRADLLQLGHDTRGVLQDLAALIGRHHAAAMAHEQARAELFLEHAHLTAERRLGDMHAVGRLAEAAKLGDMDKSAKLGKLHGAIQSQYN